ncbi:MAG: 1,4-dihydroxy-6-naphthoate synthase [Trueperaceae bacterium]|nr:1,4-dihydroxy-6-naphthoate synthase [Trueperaceae bacterium]
MAADLAPRTLRLGFSPCPNDCVVFDALVHGRVSTPLTFDVVLDDVEALNGMAAAGALDVAKVSYHAAAHLARDWRLLRAGGALGRGVGPLFVAREPLRDLRDQLVAVPGGRTTAMLLLSLYAPGVRTVPMRFDRIMPAVAAGEVDAGLVIHEGRFTYRDHDLICLQDLGRWWELTTGHLIPLGAIAVARSLDHAVQREVARVVRASVEAAFADPGASEPYVAAHAQEMDPDVRRRHVELYVNRHTLDLEDEGVAAVRALFAAAAERNLAPAPPDDLFVGGDRLGASQAVREVAGH